MNIFEEKAKELAYKHAQIIEEECQKVIDRFKCKPEDLIIEYRENIKIHISVRAVKFEIENVFHW
jgi:hypothetical protein